MTHRAGLVAAVALAGTARAAEPPFHSIVRELSPTLRAQLTGEFWRQGCPVTLNDLRLLTVRHWGFDGKAHVGQLVVAREYADPLRSVFRQLYDERFRIRHLSIATSYGPADERPSRDVSGSFHCRKAVPSPCGSGSRNWSNHAYGRAIDLNPLENPYVGCGRVRDRASDPYLDRSRMRPGMVTAAVVRAFRSIGWGWGGAWTGDTRDYMHFSANGR
jgi:D-alanyl-D-alanine carboxypeptidase-like protein